MAEVQYIPYGTDEIDYNQFLQNSANEVQNYVNSQPWSQKRKQSFLNAYQEIMNRGVIGASNDSGVWKINHNGDPFPLETKSKRDREMYGEAAYFIQQQMSRIPTRQSIEAKEKEEAEKKKGEIPTFDNKQFTIGVNNLLSKEFGGREFLTSEWNDKDKRGENGLRGITERANILANYLEEYSNKLKPEDFNFEGSAFENIDDFKAKISKAVKDLRGGNPEAIKDSLNKIGLVYDNYFNTGGDDPFTTKEGYSGTYNDYYNNYLPNQQKQKQQVEIAKQKAAYDNQYKRFRFFGQGLVGKPLTPEKSNINYLNQLATKDTLNGDEQSELVGAFKLAAKNGALENLSKEELAKFGPGYSNRPSRLKKIRDVNGIYWDSIGNRIIKPYMDIEGSTVAFQNVLDQNNTDKLKAKQKEQQTLEQQKYLSNTEWTNDQWRELGGIAADVASVIDPEPFSAGGLALTGTGLRTYNRWKDADGFTLSDAGNTAIDAGLSLLGMIPVVGDAALAARVISKLQKAAGWIGTAFAAASVPQAAKAAWNKVVNGQDMSVDDWRAIGNVLMGATQARRIQLNRAAGNAVKNSRVGNTSKEKYGEVEVQVNGKTEKVEVDEATAKELQQAYKKAGTSKEEASKALRNSRKVKEQLEAKRNSDGKPTYTKEQIENIEAPKAASGSIRGRSPIQALRETRGIKILNRTVSSEGSPITENSPLRVQYMNNNTGFFKRGDFGWNMRTKGEESANNNSWFRNLWQKAKNPYVEIPKTSTKSAETPKVSTTETPKTNTTKTSKNVSKEIKDFEQSYGTSNSSSTKPITGGYNSKPANEVNAGSFSMTIDGKKVNFKVGKRELKDINEGKITSIRNRFAKQIQQMQKDGVDEKDIARILEKLKQRGWLKQGGTIEPSLDTIVENFLKNYNK